jgi:hypothetical protein
MATITIQSNIHDVIDSVDDVADDLAKEVNKRVRRVMRALKQRAVQYVRNDADYTGKLAWSIHTDHDGEPPEMQFKVATDANIAPHAAIVEYGTGSRTNDPWIGSEVPPPIDLQQPPEFPYDAPSIDYNDEDPFDFSGYPSFAGFVGYIEEWMQKKGVAPNTGDLFTSAVLIARTIIERGNHAHPYLRPAWFDMRLRLEKSVQNAVRSATR